MFLLSFMQPALVSQAPERLSPGSWCHTQAQKLNLGNSLLEDWLFRVVGGGWQISYRIEGPNLISDYYLYALFA